RQKRWASRVQACCSCGVPPCCANANGMLVMSSVSAKANLIIITTSSWQRRDLDRLGFVAGRPEFHEGSRAHQHHHGKGDREHRRDELVAFGHPRLLQYPRDFSG